MQPKKTSVRLCSTMHCNSLLLLVAVVLLVNSVNAQSFSDERPPSIILLNKKPEISYKVNESVTLLCQAEGVPPPAVSWKKNGIELEINGDHYAYQQRSGNLVIGRPTHHDDGNYNCFARNKFGTAVGMTIKLQQATIATFNYRDTQIMEPSVGGHLVIPCNPPYSFPKGISYFGYNRPGSSKLEHIDNDDRLILDYEGNFHFANVLMNDSLEYIGDISYMCVVNNPHLGVYVQGPDYKVRPKQTPGGPTYHAPQLQWPPSTSDIAVKGQTKRLKCIFSGLPTPRVTWKAENSGGLFDVTHEGYGTEIEIKSVDVSHSGHYTCTANNSGKDQSVSHTIFLVVESPPYWAKTPLDHYVDEEDDVEIDCTVHGTPQPNITWLINGVQVYESNFTGEKSLIGYKLKYRAVTVNDSQVIQCFSSNKHGTILQNIILKVSAEKPSFMATPKDRKVVAGTAVEFECNTRGAPKPTVEWYRGKPPSTSRVYGNQYNVLDNGKKLEIRNTDVHNTGTYRCVASNKYGENEATVELTVRSPTSITSHPVNRVVNASEEVIIPCKVTTDRNELANLVVEWQKDGKRIDFKAETHMYMNKTDFSLRVKASKVRDTGEYSCNATNGLDSASSRTSTLKVKDRPDPPYDVTILQCGVADVTISWSVGNDNNDQITEFTIHYSGNFSRGNKTVSGTDFTPKSRRQDRVSVRPWSRYTFHVTATNGIGTSDLSKESGQVCDTPPDVPYRNPTGVCGNLSSAHQLVITWDPMLENEHNGEGFHYVVGYRKHRSSDREGTQVVSDPRQKSISIHGQEEPFALFEVYVLAANKLGGAAPPIERKLVRSGEGKPQVVPQNFQLVDDSFNGSFAHFSWDPVDESEEAVRGFFRGYRIVFWKSAEPSVRRSEDILTNKPFELCRPFTPDIPDVPNESKRRRRHHHRHRHVRSADDRVTGTTSQLWPLSHISAAVQVLNQANAGSDSNVVEFETPVGVPGKVSSLRVVGRGWSHLIVEWQLPLEFTGDVIGYKLDYSVAPPNIGHSTRLPIDNPNQRRYKIRRLDYSTSYRIFVTAVTHAGVGDYEWVIGETLKIADPDMPKIINILTYDNSANISWFHSDKQPPVNPGSDFFVQYKGPDNSTVVQTVDPDPDSDENWANITGLEKGRYGVWVVARSGIGDTAREARTPPWIVHIGLKDNEVIRPTHEPWLSQQASAGWFIILMCIIALLLLILLIVCILRRTRGDMYPVYEKEKMWRHQPLAPDETPFGEYTPPSENPQLGKSQGSLDSEEKPMDSDSDSLEEYEDQDASKFNEDGSFIGQYTGKHKQDTMRPAAINTSV